MHTIAILKNPGYTRVSFAGSDKLITNVLFDINKNINENDIILLSRLSFTYAIFELIFCIFCWFT